MKDRPALTTSSLLTFYCLLLIFLVYQLPLALSPWRGEPLARKGVADIDIMKIMLIPKWLIKATNNNTPWQLLVQHHIHIIIHNGRCDSWYDLTF